MPLCPSCGDTVPGGAFSCPSCGDRVDRSIPCSRCGYPTKKLMRRCPSCGKALASLRSYRSAGFKVRSRPPEERPVRGGGEDAACAWPVNADRRRLFSGKRADPYYLAAFVLSLASLVFIWVPSCNVSLAGSGLVSSLLGYQRLFSYRYRSRYRGLWINHLATAMGAFGLVMSMGVKPVI